MSSHESKLFIYGTLLFEQVWLEVVGRGVKKQPAYISGWVRLYMEGKLYPGIKRKPDSIVHGALVSGLTDQDWLRLDKFEDDIYTRSSIEVTLNNNATTPAFAYIIEDVNHKCLSAKLWSIDDFEKNNLDKFLIQVNDRMQL